jgi:hypothetical protein
MVLIVKPNRYMNRNVPISAIGSVSPVMTVERQELRNRKTISTVSAAPSISVRCTLATDTRMARELSRLISVRTPGGSSACASSSALRSPSTTAMVFSPWLFCTDSSTVRWPLNSARLSISCGPSTTSATCHSLTGTPFLRATTMSRKSSGRLSRASICTTRSCSRERMAPRGSSWFSLRTAATTWSMEMPSESIAAGRT